MNVSGQAPYDCTLTEPKGYFRLRAKAGYAGGAWAPALWPEAAPEAAPGSVRAGGNVRRQQR
jgi:hypothetical protein